MSAIVKKILITVIIAVVLGTSFLFRSQISQILYFGSGVGAGVANRSTSQPQAIASAPQILSSGERSKEKTSSNAPRNTPKNIFYPPALPSYTGRDPGEVRPVPEEVKLFTEEQKSKIYDAIRSDGRTVKALPTFFDGWIHLGLLKKTIGDYEGARDAWEYAGLIEPLNSLSFANLGELYWRYLPDYPKSESNFKISIKNKPKDVGTYVSWADLYQYSYKEKYNLAPQVLLNALRENPGDGTIMRHLAYIYELRKDFSSARDWWKKVLAQKPSDQEVKDRIEKLTAQSEGSGPQ